MNKMISVNINGNNYQVPQGFSILEACQSVGIYVPTICNHPNIPPAGKCGLCICRINNSQFVLACSIKCVDGMIIDTCSSDVKQRSYQALIQFSDMPLMPTCPEIEDIWNYFIPKHPPKGRIAEKTNAIDFDPKLCINCGRCFRLCSVVQCISALDVDFHLLNRNECISCGQCINVCPTNAISERSSISAVLHALASDYTLILEVAPSVRVAIGEYFGEKVGEDRTGRMISAARQLGFKYIFDVNFGADLAIVEEGNELLERIFQSVFPNHSKRISNNSDNNANNNSNNNSSSLPLFSSCCSGWINFVEKIHTELIDHLSTASSPGIILGKLIKTYFSQKQNINPEKLFIVALMPCVAKKD